MKKRIAAILGILSFLVLLLVFTKPSEEDFKNYMSSYNSTEDTGLIDFRIKRDYGLFGVFTYDLLVNGRKVESEKNDFRYIGILGTFYAM